VFQPEGFVDKCRCAESLWLRFCAALLILIYGIAPPAADPNASHRQRCSNSNPALALGGRKAAYGRSLLFSRIWGSLVDPRVFRAILTPSKLLRTIPVDAVLRGVGAYLRIASG